MFQTSQQRQVISKFVQSVGKHYDGRTVRESRFKNQFSIRLLKETV